MEHPDLLAIEVIKEILLEVRGTIIIVSVIRIVYSERGLLFIFSRIKKGEGQGIEMLYRCHTQTIMNTKTDDTQT